MLVNELWGIIADALIREDELIFIDSHCKLIV